MLIPYLVHTTVYCGSGNSIEGILSIKIYGTCYNIKIPAMVVFFKPSETFGPARLICFEQAFGLRFGSTLLQNKGGKKCLKMQGLKWLVLFSR